MKDKPVIIYSDWYDVAFATFTDDDKEKYDELYTLLSLPRFRVSDTDEKYRTINYWDEQGLLLSKRKSTDTWRQFSILDVVWIRILQNLKKYGMEGDEILRLKSSLFSVQDKENRYSQFAFWIYTALHKKDVFLVVLPDGRGSIATTEDIELQQALGALGQAYIALDFRYIVLSVIRSGPLKKGGKKVELNRKLDEKEIELLNALATEDVETVTAHLKKGKIDRIEWKTVEQNPDRLFEILRKKIDESPNQTITLKRQDGKVLFIEQKKSQKLP